MLAAFDWSPAITGAAAVMGYGGWLRLSRLGPVGVADDKAMTSTPENQSGPVPDRSENRP